MIVEREMNLTQELYVSPISSYTIILGKMIGSGVSSMLTLIGVLIVALLIQNPLGGMQIVRLILAIPVFCLVGTSRYAANVHVRCDYPYIAFQRYPDFSGKNHAADLLN